MINPTTQDVKRAYAWGLSGTSRTTQECDDEFDRWLNEIRAEAWDEGFQTLRQYKYKEQLSLLHAKIPPEEPKNPYHTNEK